VIILSSLTHRPTLRSRTVELDRLRVLDCTVTPVGQPRHELDEQIMGRPPSVHIRGPQARAGFSRC